MKRTRRYRTVLAAASGLSLISALTGCASTSSTELGATSFQDGTYTADGTYVSPGGQEAIAVAVTVKNNLITAVSVKTVAADPEAAEYQARFASGISAVVVGKNLAGLQVSNLAGSSLTNVGFNQALSAIRSQAKNS